jgi:hypothetical protein
MGDDQGQMATHVRTIDKNIGPFTVTLEHRAQSFR